MKIKKAKPKIGGKLTRKQQRKESRKQKKQRRNDYYTNRNKPGKYALNTQLSIEKDEPTTDLKDKSVKNSENRNTAKSQVLSSELLRKKEQKEQKKLENEMKKQRKKQMIEANKEEDRIIKQLEKQLGLNKRKTQNLPKSFAEEGLDYLLDVCDSERMKNAVAAEKELNENDEFDEDFALMAGKTLESDDEDDNTFKEVDDWSEENEDKVDPDGNMEEDNDSTEDEKLLSGDGLDDDDSENGTDGEKSYTEEDSEIEFDNNLLTNKRKKEQQSNSKKRKIADDDDDDDDDDVEAIVDDNEDLELSCKKKKRKGEAESNKPKTKYKKKSELGTVHDDDSSDLENLSSNKKIVEQKRSKESRKKTKNKKRAINEVESDDFSDLENLISEEEELELQKPKKNKNKNKDEQKAINEIENDFSDLENLSSEGDEDENNVKNIKGAVKINPDGTWEDIYGRMRDQGGAVITRNEESKYIPPGMREKLNSTEDSKRNEKLVRLKRQLKGLLNRLAESNMHNIAMQIEDLYMNNSRNDMNDTLTNLIMESLVTEIITPERLLTEHIVLLTVLHANIGTEIGAHFLQYVIQRFNELLQSQQAVEDKTLDNIVNILAQMYNFKIFDAKLMYEVIQKLAEGFKEKDIECILHILKSVGFALRKDDPLALKNLILDLQKRATNVPDEEKDDPRVKFMLDILLAIKNNNVTKIPNYDVSYSEHLKKVLRGHIRKGNYVAQLNILLEDLLKAEERGKWWIVGSAWTGGDREDPDNEKSEKNTGKSSGFSTQLLELARKQRMNTDNRRNIFCIIMSAEDYMDAFEKLLKLGLKNQQDREIINVILHCCLQEKKYNPYYAHLAQKFCDYDRRYQMTIKYSIWDKVKALDSHSGSQISNLAKLLIHLFIEKGLPVTTLKVVEFSELDKFTLRFIRQILIGILLHENQEVCLEVFAKVAVSEKLKLFRESLRLFIHHFLLRNVKTDGPEEQILLEGRAKAVERFLASKGRNLLNV